MTTTLELVQAAAVGDRPRFWAASITEAETLVSAAGSLVAVDDLHRLPSEHGEPWAIVETQAAVAHERDRLRARVAQLSAEVDRLTLIARPAATAADSTLAADVASLITACDRLTPGPWEVHRFDVESGLCSYQIQASNREAGGLVVGACDEHDTNPRKRAQARINAHGLVELRNRAPALLARLRARLEPAA